MNIEQRKMQFVNPLACIKPRYAMLVSVFGGYVQMMEPRQDTLSIDVKEWMTAVLLFQLDMAPFSAVYISTEDYDALRLQGIPLPRAEARV